MKKKKDQEKPSKVENSKSLMEKMAKDWKKSWDEEHNIKNKFNNDYICPHCGRCPICGRRYNEWPWYPHWKRYWWEEQPYTITLGSTNTLPIGGGIY